MWREARGLAEGQRKSISVYSEKEFHMKQNQIELPKFKSHKTVQAAKIQSLCRLL